MPELQPETGLRCSYCGVPAGDGWLGIEVWRDDGSDYKDLKIDIEKIGFCTAEHAGSYFLDGRLPPPDFSESQPLPSTWRDRVADASVFLSLLATLLLALLGGWTLVQRVLH